MFDLDDFKRVNDVYGHGAGDQLLIQLARLARETVRGSDVVCRIGGEEFGVIMPSCDAGDALGLAARLTERLSDGRVRAGRADDRLDRDLAGPAPRDEPARAGRVRGGGDDDGEGARQEPDRSLRRRRDGAAGGRCDCGRTRRALDRASEDAAVARGEAQPAERRAADRRDDRDRASAADRLPQLPCRAARRRRAAADHVRRRVRLERALRRGRLHAARSARASPAASPRRASRCSCRTRSSASSGSASRARRRSRSRSPSCRCATARG